MKPFCYYSFFEIPFDFDKEELFSAYNYLMLKTLKSNKKENEKKEELDKIMDIYNILSNEEMKKKYDTLVKIKAIHVYEYLQEINKMMEKIIGFCSKNTGISTRSRLEIKKAMKYINDILENEQDVAFYFEEHYLSCLMEHNSLVNEIKKRISRSSL